jgi:hypothetical protein
VTDSYGAQPPQNTGGDLGGQLTGQSIGQQPPVFRKPREPWIPPNAAGPRPPTEWGKADPYAQQAQGFGQVDTSPFMPQGRDVQGLLRNSVGFLAKSGSPGVSNAAMMMLFANKNFLDSYMKARDWRMRMADAEMKAQRDRVIDLQQKESEEYGIAFDLATRDPTHFKDGLQARLWEIANSHNDTAMKQALSAGGIKAAEALNQSKDAHLRSLLQYRQNVLTIEKEEAAQAAEKKFLHGDSTSSAAPPPSIPPATSTPVPGSPSAPATATPAATPATPSATAPPAPVSGMPTLAPADSPDVDRASNDLLMGRKADWIPNTDAARQAASNRENQKREFINGVISNPNLPQGETPEAVAARRAAIMPLIQNASPELAGEVERIMKGGNVSAANETRDPERTALEIASTIDPRFSSPRLLAQQEMLKQRAMFNSRSRDLSNLQIDLSRLRIAIPRNVRDMDNLIQVSKRIDPTQIPIINRAVLRGEKSISGGADIQEYFTLLHAVQRDFGSIFTTLGGTGRGQYTVYAQRAMADFLQAGTTPQGLEGVRRAAIRDYNNLLIPQVNEINIVQDATFGRKADGSPVAPPASAQDILQQINRPPSSGQAIPAPPGLEDGKVYTFKGKRYFISNGYAEPL